MYYPGLTHTMTRKQYMKIAGLLSVEDGYHIEMDPSPLSDLVYVRCETQEAYDNLQYLLDYLRSMKE